MRLIRRRRRREASIVPELYPVPETDLRPYDVFAGRTVDAIEIWRELEDIGIVTWMRYEGSPPHDAYIVLTVEGDRAWAAWRYMADHPRWGRFYRDSTSPRPFNYWAVAEFDDADQAREAVDVLERARIHSVVTDPDSGLPDDLGWVVSVKNTKLEAAAERLRAHQADHPAFTPRDLLEELPWSPR